MIYVINLVFNKDIRNNLKKSSLYIIKNDLKLLEVFYI